MNSIKIAVELAEGVMVLDRNLPVMIMAILWAVLAMLEVEL